MDWTVLLAPGGLVCILAGMVAVNFKALFGRKDKGVEAELARCREEHGELEAERDKLDAQVDHWRERYYNLLVTGEKGNVSGGEEPQTGE